MVALMAALLVPFPSERAQAKVRAHHEHEDLFDEGDLQLGFKIGPQVSGFTSYAQGNANVTVKSGIRFSGGLATKFIYSLPRFELDMMWNCRAWVNSENTLNTVAFPILVKLPLEVDRGVDFEIGVGGHPELTLFGADPHNSFMMGVLGSAGVSIDFVSWVFEFEARYNVGIDSVSSFYPGASNRDLQILAGVLWHF